MRVGVIRGDIPGPLALMDLEPISRYNPPTEPEGQERRVGRPDTTVVGTALGDIPAGRTGSTDISAGATVTLGVDDNLEIKLAAAAPFTSVTVAAGVYASGAALVAAVNTALATAGVDATARLDDFVGTFLVIQSNTTGTGSYVEVDADPPSTFNGVVGWAPGATTVPTTAAVITATLPVGGPLDVSIATLIGTVGSGGTQAQYDALADSIAPQFIETDVAIKSFQVGMISGFLAPTWNPDPNRLPPFTPGAAIEVVADDGVTPFSAPLTVIGAAASGAPNAGDITITGTNLGHADPEIDDTTVRVTSADGATSIKLHQYTIRTTLSGGTQGGVAPTTIVIPASLLGGLGVAGSTVIVQFTSFASNLFTVT